MISWLWLIPAFFGGILIGVLLVVVAVAHVIDARRLR